MNEIWPGSTLSLADAAESSVVADAAVDMAVVCFLLVVSVVVLLSYQRACMALLVSAQMLVNPNRAKDHLDDSYCVGSIVLTFLLSIPFMALVFVRTGLSSRSYWSVLLILALFFAYRRIAFFFVQWLCGGKEMFRNTEVLSYGAFLVMSVLMCVPLLVVPYVESVSTLPVVIFLVAAALTVFVAYSVAGTGLIIQSGFSAFFWILYLCAFEFLPLCVTVDIIVS